MKSSLTSQQGAFLVLLLIIVVAVLGFAALSLDVGRVVILRAEMQNAVDAAALAAAKELDGSPGARARAVANARYALEHNSHFAKVAEILGENTLPYDPDDGSGAFTFFCVIGTESDVGPDEPGVEFDRFCGAEDPYGDSGPDRKKYEATSDEEAHYVRIQLLPEGQAVDNFSLNLIFLPILEVFGGDEMLEELALTASALAGRDHFACNYPPLLICDPFEDGGSTFQDEMVGAGEGRLLSLVKQTGGGAWQSGNFGLLVIDDGSGDTVKKRIIRQLADEGDNGCTPPVVDTRTGNPQWSKDGINTRFGVYNDPDAPIDHYPGYNNIDSEVKDKWDLYPPAPNVASFPQDTDMIADPDNIRVGDGTWDCDNYWTNTQGHDSGTKPVGCGNAGTNSITRWEAYKEETKKVEDGVSGMITNAVIDGKPPGDIDRRRLWVAVLSCDALGITGNSDSNIPIKYPDGFAEFFLTEVMGKPSGANLYAEFIRWGTEDTGIFHVDIKLYE